MNEPNPPGRGATRLAPALLLPLALLFIALLPAGAQADPIILTGGEIVIDRGNRREVTINLTGPNFSVRYRLDLPSPYNFSAGMLGTSTFSCGCDGAGLATFDGYTTQYFFGSGRFDTATISGTISLFTAGHPGPQPLFTLSYAGTGFFAVNTPTFTRFVITGGTPSLVPEPATLMLLGTGLAGVAARVGRRRKGRSEDGESPPV